MDIIQKTITPEPYEMFEYNGRTYQNLVSAERAQKIDMLTDTVYVVIGTKHRGSLSGEIEVYSTLEKAKRSLSNLSDRETAGYRIEATTLDLREIDVPDELLLESHKKQIEKSQKIVDFLEKRLKGMSSKD